MKYWLVYAAFMIVLWYGIALVYLNVKVVWELAVLDLLWAAFCCLTLRKIYQKMNRISQ